MVQEIAEVVRYSVLAEMSHNEAIFCLEFCWSSRSVQAEEAAQTVSQEVSLFLRWNPGEEGVDGLE